MYYHYCVVLVEIVSVTSPTEKLVVDSIQKTNLVSEKVFGTLSKNLD